VIAGSGPSSDPPRLALGVQEVADALGVSRELVRQMIRTGKLPSVKLGRRRLISRKALERFLAGGDGASSTSTQTVAPADRMTQRNPLGS
jgi:excisionase family DNA binding protein